MGTRLEDQRRPAAVTKDRPTKAESLFIEAQERFEGEHFEEVAPNAVTQALFEIRLSLWLCLAVLCLILWRLW
ncbi:hypothetical protein CK220_19600 [Mesorhizobium sp. WSM3860]|nr:hypothetical protein CK220_19600 [Mesorhizobium sp. WSM3860]